MSLNAEKFIRKVRPVEAIKISAENMAEVAAWCNGLVVPVGGLGQDNTEPYIHVAVRNPRRDSDSQAFAGMWLIREDFRNYRVINNKQFRNSYEALEAPRPAPVPAVKPNGAAEGIHKVAGKRNANHHGVPTPVQVGAVEVVPGTPAPADSSGLTTGRLVGDATSTVIDQSTNVSRLGEHDGRQPMSAFINKETTPADIAKGAVSIENTVEAAAAAGIITEADAAEARSELSEIRNEEAHDAVAAQDDMVALGVPVADPLCDECGSPVLVTGPYVGNCSVNSEHIVNSAAQL